jgi:hypothetical protein
MGVTTTAYSMSKSKLDYLKKNQDLLDIVFGFKDDPKKIWQFETYEFGKGWEETVDIIGRCGFPSFRKKLNPGRYWDCDGYEVWSIPPSIISSVALDLETADFETIKAAALKKGMTDYWGEEIPDYLYDYYIGDIRQIREFLRRAAETGNYLLFSTI